MDTQYWLGIEVSQDVDPNFSCDLLHSIEPRRQQ